LRIFLNAKILNAIPETLPAFLAQHVNSVTPALIDRGRPVSFRELAAESRRVAQGLRGAGVQPGDCVALWLPNVTAWLATFLACAQLGAVVVSVNTRFRSHELADILQRSRARMLVFWPGFKGMNFTGILAACDPRALENLQAYVAYDETGNQPPGSMLGRVRFPICRSPAVRRCLRIARRPGRAAQSSPRRARPGRRKFVLHDQRTVIRHAFDVVKGFSLGPDSALLLAPPLCGVFGFCGAMAGARRRPPDRHDPGMERRAGGAGHRCAPHHAHQRDR
jgi:fatty-acyl-CoA synthase